MGEIGFIGNFQCILDDKNRFNIPAKFRKQLDENSQETLILSIGFEKCIHVFPLSKWKKETAHLLDLDMTIAENRIYVRTISTQATDVTFDKQGRIVLAGHLKDYAEIEKELIVVGVFDKMEIWNPQFYRNHMQQYGNNLDVIVQGIRR